MAIKTFMRTILFLTSIIFLTFDLKAQDTIVPLNGRIEIVRIIKIDKLNDIISYISGSDTLFRKTSSIASYIYHSDTLSQGVYYYTSDAVIEASIKYYRILKSDGDEIIGAILKQDEREILVQLKDKRKIIIPQYVIKEIAEIDNNKISKTTGEYIGVDKFATRYFISTNGLPIKKGENYVQWSLFGADFQFGLSDHVGVGIMTSWIGIPIIGTIKSSFKLSENAQFGLGAVVGSATWIKPDLGGALPFATLSFGDRSANIAFSGGYGAIWNNGETNGRALFSVAGMVKVSNKISIVFDSFLMPATKPKTETYTYTSSVYNPNTGNYDIVTNTSTIETYKKAFGLIIPGIRWHQSEGKAIQFGFTGCYAEGQFIEIPIPTVMWYRTL